MFKKIYRELIGLTTVLVVVQAFELSSVMGVILALTNIIVLLRISYVVIMNSEKERLVFLVIAIIQLTLALGWYAFGTVDLSKALITLTIDGAYFLIVAIFYKQIVDLILMLFVWSDKLKEERN